MNWILITLVLVALAGLGLMIFGIGRLIYRCMGRRTRGYVALLALYFATCVLPGLVAFALMDRLDLGMWLAVDHVVVILVIVLLIPEVGYLVNRILGIEEEA